MSRNEKIWIICKSFCLLPQKIMFQVNNYEKNIKKY